LSQTIQAITDQIHRPTPPGAHGFQADVGTVHDLMETEFYRIEAFTSRRHFLHKATTYLLFFNLARANSDKENKTPWGTGLQHVRRGPRQ
jgi:hypothetical protein